MSIKPGDKLHISQQDHLVRLAAICVIVAATLFVLKQGAAVLVPVAEAIVVWFIVNGLARKLKQLPVPWLQERDGVALTAAVTIVFAICFAALYIGVRGTLNFGPNAASVQNSFDPIVTKIAEVLGKERADVVDRALDVIALETVMQQVVIGVLGLLNQFGVVAVYVAFLLADQAFFDQKMRVLYRDDVKREQARAVLKDIGRQISTYLSLMAQISAMTAVLSYIVMIMVGLEHAAFWAILVFFLNFIPTIGSILGTLVPCLFAVLQFQSFGPIAVLFVGLGAVQITMGNVVFPRMAGNSLNLSFFLTIFALFVWGALWGVTGMFLAVPLTAIVLILLARFEITRPIAILMSKTGVLAGASPPLASDEKAQN